MGLISLGHISLIGLSCFSDWLARARKKTWYSGNNDTLQDHFIAAVAAAARTIFQQPMQAAHGVAMVSSATKITNAAIWYYCIASHWFVREGWLCYELLPTSRLDSSFFRDALQNAKQLFSLRLPQMTKYCVMRECENIHLWISLSGDLVFSHQQGIYSFQYQKRILEISSRDLTSFLLQLI
jgi:hypothetical protein